MGFQLEGHVRYRDQARVVSPIEGCLNTIASVFAARDASMIVFSKSR